MRPSTTAPRWSHVALNCRDRAATERFYVRWFGFRRARVVGDGPSAVVFLRRGAALLELFTGTGGRRAAAGDGPAAVGTVRHLAFQVDDLDRFLAEAGDRLPVALGPLAFDRYIEGWRSVWLSDPDGVTVEVSQGYRDDGAGAPEAGERLYRRFAEALNRRRYELLDGLLAPDFVDHHPGLVDVEGVDGYRTNLAAVVAALDMTATPGEVRAVDDRVFTRVRLTGRHVGTFLGVAPTGRAVDWWTHELWRVEGGRFAERWAVDDLLGLVAQLGVAVPTWAAPAESTEGVRRDVVDP